MGSLRGLAWGPSEKVFLRKSERFMSLRRSYRNSQLLVAVKCKSEVYSSHPISSSLPSRSNSVVSFWFLSLSD